MTTLVTIKDNIPPTVTANPISGLYNTAKIVTLKMSEAGTIYYTLNGITPSTKYTGPIKISKTTTLKFLAVDLAGNLSSLYSQTYTISPKVTTTTPTNKKTGISKTSTIIIKFSENIINSLNYNKITIKNNITHKTIKLSKIIKRNTLYLKTSKRSAKTWYTVSIPKAAIKDYADNKLQTNYTFKFKTAK